jgi:hypothetical protein
MWTRMREGITRADLNEYARGGCGMGATGWTPLELEYNRVGTGGGISGRQKRGGDKETEGGELAQLTGLD